MRAGTAITGSARHVTGVVAQAILIAAIAASLLFAASIVLGNAPGGAGSVFAGKGGHGNLNSTGSSITLDQADASLNLGSKVTFTTNVAGLTSNEYALVYVRCMEDGTAVWGQLDVPGTTFVLGGGSSNWWTVGGTATCVGYLKAYGTHGGSDTIRTLDQTASFSAN